MSRTRNGKIARLPFAVREEVCRRLRDNLTGAEILAWLNAEHVGTGQATFNDENLSNWREGGFADWLGDERRVDHVRKLGETCLRIAEAAGHSITDGAAAIAGGRLLEVLEAGADVMSSEDDEDGGQSSLTDVVIALAKLRASEAQMMSARSQKERLKQKEGEIRLARDKFELIVCNKILELIKNTRAQEIADSGLSNAEKIAQLRLEFFKDVDALEKAGEVVLPQ